MAGLVQPDRSDAFALGDDALFVLAFRGRPSTVAWRVLWIVLGQNGWSAVLAEYEVGAAATCHFEVPDQERVRVGR